MVLIAIGSTTYSGIGGAVIFKSGFDVKAIKAAAAIWITGALGLKNGRSSRRPLPAYPPRPRRRGDRMSMLLSRHTRRREVIAALAGGAAGAWPLSTGAQQKTNRVVGFLGSAPNVHLTSSFEIRLRDLGWINGQNIVIEYRYAAGDMRRVPALVDELVRLKPDIMVAGNHQAAVALRRATAAIPIVVAILIDPVGLGLVASHARPGGNVTGILIHSGMPSREAARALG
jgi:hypothetical protein